MVHGTMSRLLLLLTCAFLTVVRVPLVQGGALKEGALEDVTVDQEESILDEEPGEEIEATPVMEAEVEQVEAKIREVEGGLLDDQIIADNSEKTATTPSMQRGWISNVDVKKPRGHNLCRWSWSTRRCFPEDMCNYKYQFLDATISESCRLKDFKTKRSVFAVSDFEVKPGYALAGAAGLFTGDLLAIRYTDWLKKFPLLFNAVQGFVLLFSGDTLFQVLEQGWAKKVGIKLWRMVRSGLIGALNNGLVHYSYYKWIDKRFPYHMFSEKTWGPPDGARSKLAVGFTKWAIEWPTIGVYKIASMYFLIAAMSGSMDTLKDRLKDSFILTWLRSLQVWPIYDMILYAYVPTAHRPLFNSFMSIAWGGYLSHVSQPHDEEEEDGGGERGGEEDAAAREATASTVVP